MIATIHALLAHRTQPPALTVLTDTTSLLMTNKPAKPYQLVALRSAAEDAPTAVMKDHVTPALTTTTNSRTVLMPLFVSETALLVTQLLIAPTNANNAKSITAALAQPTDNAPLV